MKHTALFLMLTALAASAYAQSDKAKRLEPPAAATIKSKAAEVPALSAPVAGGLPAGGQGAGFHSPQSPFPQMKPRSDVVDWSVLTDVQQKKGSQGGLLPQFKAAQLALHHKKQRVQGFMMPLGAGETQTRFLLSAVPLTCSFCLPGGPESMIEVYATKPIRYEMKPLVIEGEFEVLPDDPLGVYYRMRKAVQVD